MTADLAIIGAGPAGLAAALTAARAGVTVTVVDAGARVGGQIHRQPLCDEDGGTGPVGTHLPARFHPLQHTAGVEILSSRAVWDVRREEGGYALLLATLDGEGAGALSARALVLATGASELALPFPGWDLPGVTTAGAAQTLLKSEKVLIGRRVVVAGSGPFLLPVAATLVRGGARVAAVVEAVDLTSRAGALAAALSAPRLWREALSYLAPLVAARVPLLRGAAITSAEGTERLERVVVHALDARWRPVPGTARTFAADAACVSFGFVPRLELARQLGLADLTAPDRPGAAVRHEKGATALPGVFVAGELTGIGGAHLAELEGQRAGAAAAAYLKGRNVLQQGAPAALARAERTARRLERLYLAPRGWLSWCDDDTLLCRCEDVRVGALRRVLADGATTVREVRSLTRCGMGYCQGRTCGPALQLALGEATGLGTEAVGDLHLRPVASPVVLSAVADGDHRLDASGSPDL